MKAKNLCVIILLAIFFSVLILPIIYLRFIYPESNIVHSISPPLLTIELNNKSVSFEEIVKLTHSISPIFTIFLIILTVIALCFIYFSCKQETRKFINDNISILITSLSSLIFLTMFLCFPSYTKSHILELLLFLSFPLIILAFSITFKLQNQNNYLDYFKKISSKTGFNRITLFNNDGECKNYRKSRLKTAKTVRDLTWAEKISSSEENIIKDNDFSDTAIKDSDSPEERKKKLTAKYKGYIESLKGPDEYQEIFIFKINGSIRIDRANKFEAIYYIAKDTPGLLNKYSCKYFSDTPLERLQFTIFDDKEILFTSSIYKKCLIKGETICDIMMKYFERAWNDTADNAIPLIENGQIVANDEVLKEIIPNAFNPPNEKV